MISLKENKANITKQIQDFLAKPHLTATERSKLSALNGQLASIRSTEERAARAEATLAEARKEIPVTDGEEFREAKFDGAFARYLRTGESAKDELRTYAGLTTSGVPIPEGFNAKYSEKLKSYAGVREVSTVITTKNGDGIKWPIGNDTANTGERLNESDPVSLANPTFSKITLGAYRYSSKGVLYSAQLLQDSGIDVGSYLSSIFARRIAFLQNQEFTLGGSGAMTGLIPSVTSIQTAATTNSVGLGELVALQAIDAAYLPGSSYMFSPGVERILKSLVTTTGEPIYKGLHDGSKTLCGYGYTLNSAMPSSLSASAKTILFGNFKEAVVIRDVVPSMLVSAQRYAELRQMYAAMRHDADCQVVIPEAINVLQQAAV
jgi:HK97 family phage major capsid protein